MIFSLVHGVVLDQFVRFQRAEDAQEACQKTNGQRGVRVEMAKKELNLLALSHRAHGPEVVQPSTSYAPLCFPVHRTWGITSLMMWSGLCK